MTVQPRQLHPGVHSWSDLDRWLRERIAHLEPDCYDGETIGHIGQARHNRSIGAMSALRDVLGEIAPMVDAETAELTEALAEGSAEARWKEAHPDADELTLRRLAGDR